MQTLCTHEPALCTHYCDWCGEPFQISGKQRYYTLRRYCCRACRRAAQIHADRAKAGDMTDYDAHDPIELLLMQEDGFSVDDLFR